MFDLFLFGGPPVFDSQVSFFGLPLTTILFALAFAALVGATLWIRRISRVDPEPRSFRATTHPGPLDRLTWAAAIAAVAFAAVFALGTLATR
jgi:hypothetical protein